MKSINQKLLYNVSPANRNAERAYWWLKNIDAAEAQRLRLNELVLNALSLLQKVDNISIDISIIIKNKTLQ